MLIYIHARLSSFDPKAAVNFTLVKAHLLRDPTKANQEGPIVGTADSTV